MSQKMKRIIVSLLLMVTFVLTSAESCTVEGNGGSDPYHFGGQNNPPQPSMLCDSKCGCLDGGDASGYAYCMATK